MPFLDDKELASLQQEIHDANVKKDEIEKELLEKSEELSKVSGKSRGINVFFGLLAGAALAFATFLYTKKPSSGTKSVDIEAIKQAEAARILDSIADLKANDESEEEDGGNVNSIADDVKAISKKTRGKTIYSVQVGVFSRSKYPLLSKTIAGTTTQANLFKYSIGLFNTLKEAQDFRRQLVKIGFSDAFVASYVNGKRQKIHRPN